MRQVMLALMLVVAGSAKLARAEEVEVAGSVRDADGKLAAGVLISIGTEETRTGPDGRFAMKVADDLLWFGLRATTADQKFGAVLPLREAATANVRVRLKPCVTMVLRVLGPDKKPVANFPFELRPSGVPGSGKREQRTDTKGECRLSGLVGFVGYTAAWGAFWTETTPVGKGDLEMVAREDDTVVIELKPLVLPKGTLAATPQTYCQELSNFCINQSDHLLLCDTKGKRVRVITAEDRLVRDFTFDFGPEAVCCREDGVVVVAGSGQLVLLAADGRKMATANLPKSQRVMSLSTTGKEVFVLLDDERGFTLHRFSEQLREPKAIAQGLRGCCGQLDVQANKGVLYVADNARSQVTKLDRDGKTVGSFGKHNDGTEESFKGCCEPKNVGFDKEGNLYAVESEPCCVKKFTTDGKYLGFVGTVREINSCTRAPVGVSQDGRRVYLLDGDCNVIRPVVPGKPKKSE